MRETKTVQRFLNRADIKAGRKPVYEDYLTLEQEKQSIYQKAQNADEYDRLYKAMIERRKI